MVHVLAILIATLGSPSPSTSPGPIVVSWSTVLQSLTLIAALFAAAATVWNTARTNNQSERNTNTNAKQSEKNAIIQAKQSGMNSEREEFMRNVRWAAGETTKSERNRAMGVEVLISLSKRASIHNDDANLVSAVLASVLLPHSEDYTEGDEFVVKEDQDGD